MPAGTAGGAGHRNRNHESWPCFVALFSFFFCLLVRCMLFFVCKIFPSLSTLFTLRNPIIYRCRQMPRRLACLPLSPSENDIGQVNNSPGSDTYRAGALPDLWGLPITKGPQSLARRGGFGTRVTGTRRKHKKEPSQEGRKKDIKYDVRKMKDGNNRDNHASHK